MNKPTSLRQYLIDSVPYLQQNPDSLQIHVSGGHIGCNLEVGVTHRVNYTLQLFVIEMKGATQNVMVPLLSWLRANQIDFKKDDLKFEVDILSATTFDLSINFPLSENCVVTVDGNGQWTATYPDEIQPPHLQPTPATLAEINGNDGRT